MIVARDDDEVFEALRIFCDRLGYDLDLGYGEEAEIHYEIEYRHARNLPWFNLSKVIGGIQDGFDTLDEAKETIERARSIGEVDTFYRGLQYRVIKVSREEASA